MGRPALSATRAMLVLNYLAAHPTERFGLSVLAQRLSINVASLHTVLATLTTGGYLERDPRSRTYTLGPTLVAIGDVALAQHPVVEAAREEAKRLSKRMGLDAAVFARAGSDVTVVAHSGLRHPLGLPLHIGERLPLQPPLGSIFIAWSDSDTIEQFLAGVSHAELDANREGIAAVAGRGFLVCIEAENGPLGGRIEHLVRIQSPTAYHVSSVTAPIFDADGRVSLTLALVGFPGSSLLGSEVLAMGREVCHAALLVTKRTRGTIPPPFAIVTEATDPVTDSILGDL